MGLDSPPIFRDVEQRSDAWYELRRGILTASSIGQLMTPTLKVAANDSSRALTRQLVAERVTGWCEPSYRSPAMWRGVEDEPRARALYADLYAPVTECGFVDRLFDGHRLGCSPDGLVNGGHGLLEIKSAEPKRHLATILADEIPGEHMAQVQCGMLVTGRDWCDFVSYCGGMPMWRTRVLATTAWQDAILAALHEFELNAAHMVARYQDATRGLPLTEHITYDDDIRI